MKRPRYSDASEDKRREMYIKDFDEIESIGQSRYIAGGLGVFCMLGLVGIASYAAYPFLEMADKYKDSIEIQFTPKRGFVNNKVIDYKDNCEN